MFKYDNHISMIEDKMKFEITKIGERGQLVIPLAFRESLNLKKGEKFMVIEENGTIMLKRLVPPTREEIKEMIRDNREHAKKNNITQADLDEALALARKK